MEGDFNNLIKTGSRRAWSDDSESQQNFCKVIAQARGMQSVDFQKYGAFFLPNDDYLANYCGSAIRSPEYYCYTQNGECIWNNNLIFPIANAGGTIVGLGGFNPLHYIEAHEKNDWSIIYYQYSNKNLFQKGNYIYTPCCSFKEVLECGYICIVDGLFDAISLNEAGFCAGCLMGSSVTDEIVAQLRLIRKVIIIADNDDAGIKLQKTLLRRVPHSLIFRQGVDKDIDGALKSAKGAEIKMQLQSLINANNPF